MKQKNPALWKCPLCVKLCPFGAMGCADPLQCEEEKNVNFLAHVKRKKAQMQDNAKGVGISEISNEE